MLACQHDGSRLMPSSSVSLRGLRAHLCDDAAVVGHVLILNLVACITEQPKERQPDRRTVGDRPHPERLLDVIRQANGEVRLLAPAPSGSPFGLGRGRQGLGYTRGRPPLPWLRRVYMPTNRLDSRCRCPNEADVACFSSPS